MTGRDYILAKQTAWARNRGTKLVGSKLERGRPAYTSSLDENLFQELLPDTRKAFEAADGGELIGNPSKMAAIHSSSALAVNVFEYWKKVRDIATIAAACGLCTKGSTRTRTMRFEQKFEICSMFQRSPNLDVVIDNDDQSRIRVYGIESKCAEAYSSRPHWGLDPRYLDPKYVDLTRLWETLPATRSFASTISPTDGAFKHLHAAQLIKHILGLTKRHSLHGFRLLYLWYDVFGEEGVAHREEVDKFTDIVRQDGVLFQSLTYQELIARLSGQARDGHTQYVEYISTRYL